MRKIMHSSVNYLPGAVRHQIKHIPGLAAFQRWLVNRVLSEEPFVHTVNAGPASGLRFEVTLPLDKAIWAGTYEPEFAAAIARRVNRGDVCYDIGGYRGYMSGVMALAGASSVVVFEPLPANQQAVRRLCELNSGLPIELHPIAVGHVDGFTQLKVMTDTSMGKLTGSPFQISATPLDEIAINVRRIDSLVARGEIPPPDIMKIDVEGAEVDVLKGAIGTLKTKLPIVFLEAHSDMLEEACAKELLAMGYGVQRLGFHRPLAEEPRHLIAQCEVV